MCPKGVIKIDIKPYVFENLNENVNKKINYAKDNGGEINMKIRGMEIFAGEANGHNISNKQMREILQVESNYICPDGSYIIHLKCPIFTKNLKKSNVDERSFVDCPFCKFPDHQYQIFPSGNDARGDCPNKDKMPSFGFINSKNDYLSCCIQQHS